MVASGAGRSVADASRPEELLAVDEAARLAAWRAEDLVTRCDGDIEWLPGDKWGSAPEPGFRRPFGEAVVVVVVFVAVVVVLALASVVLV